MSSNGAFHEESSPSTALVIPPQTVPPQAHSLAIQRAPDVVLEEATRAAKALAQVIEGKPKKLTFNGKTYLQFEDWQTLGRFYGVTAVSRSTKFVEFGSDENSIQGFEAQADALLVATGQIISSAEALCLDDEPNWNGKPLFQLKSMAQTRACAKALRNVLAWVVVLAGYAPTPAEEMDGATSPEDSGVGLPRRKSAASEKPDFISEAQQKRLFTIAKEANISKDEVREILNRFGFEFSREITKAKYPAICTEVKKAAAA
jgi:hypothetical protein